MVGYLDSMCGWVSRYPNFRREHFKAYGTRPYEVFGRSSFTEP